ncbi:hypothetical protein RDE2_35600 [Rhodococcus sp. RDE2]|nr:hypothetical protein RDE2_35600 [Rhodococcus sp. RDE2]
MSQKSTIDLSEFDAEAADLHLEICTTCEQKSTLHVPPYEIPGSVHARSLYPIGVCDESIRCECGAPMVSTRERMPGKVKLSYNPDGNRMKTAVENQGMNTCHRSADGDRTGWFDQPTRRNDRCLSRAVSIEEAALRGPTGYQVCR